MSDSSQTNVALELHGPKDLRLGTRPVPQPLSDEVLIRVHSCGICGTDLHFIAHGGMGTLKFNYPVVIGHEGSGTVVSVGSAVKSVKAGDRVAIEPGEYCGFCKYCNAGENQLCGKGSVFTEDNVSCRDGLLQQYVCYPEYMINKLPENVSLETAAVAEPLACVLHALKRVPLSPGQIILVSGAGPMGLLSALAAKAHGALKVVITDTNPGRVNHALSIGIDGGYVIDTKKSQEEVVKELKAVLGGEPDVTLECTGFESPLRLAIAITKKGGKISLIGLGADSVNVSLSFASMKELDLLGAAKYDSNSYKLALSLLESGKIKADAVVSHKIALKDFQQAFDLIKEGKASKVLIQP